ncbi:MAG TPA: DUF4832 domain-containing protein [archaeon]|nr:DUF4832 domain-containing protein [archaeon]
MFSLRVVKISKVCSFLIPVIFFAFLSLLPASPGAGGIGYREDFNADGKVAVTDVIALILFARDNPDDPRCDLNGDGVYSISDALELLLKLVRDDLTAVIQPVETDQTLHNPGRGFISTGCFNDWILRGVPRHPKCSVAQFRWYWDEIEPVEGQINFQLIDSMIEKARANDQKLMFRVMCQDGVIHCPRWLLAAGAKGEPYTDDFKNWQPHYDDPVFLEKHENLIKALGQRYDGHPDIDHVDIGSVGRWGEWHTSGTGMAMPPDSIRFRIIDMYLDNFKKTPLIMQIGGEAGLAYAVTRGAGWRADCLGDMGGFSSTWNHMEDFYQQALDAAEANDAWKQAPVIFETCWTMRFWYERKWDIDYILSEALRWHVTGMNNGSDTIPEAWADKVWEFEKKMGYRFVLKELVHASSVDAGDILALEMEWENKGVAPCYLNHPLAVELRALEDTSKAWVMETDTDITGWLPGPASLKTGVAVPQEIPPGEYELGVTMLDPYSKKPRVMFAIQGRSADGWYRLSRVRVR